MDMKQFSEVLTRHLPAKRTILDAPMKAYTTFKVGGPADLMVKPQSIEEVKSTIELCKMHQVPYYILGNGSNVLVSDKGFRGVMILISQNMSDIVVEGNTITAQAGALLSKVATVALKNNLTGFEFAHGIPGTIGGAAVMNAGAYDGEMKQVLTKCEVLDPSGNVLTLSNEELELGYRTSIIPSKGYVVLSVTISLKKGDNEQISSYMKELMNRRKEKQPLQYPSAGSTFKRPTGHFAGKLIMDAGLKGYQIGGAVVSEKHCGFIINRGDATAEDILALIKHVQKVVLSKYNVLLEPEVRIL